MSFLELTKSRYSARKFKDQPVEQDKLAQILEAGRVAPTAKNNQPQRIKIITTPEDFSKVDECTPCRFGAQLVLLICYDKEICWQRHFDGALSGEVDASIVTTSMMFAAEALGLGTCWVMHFDAQKASEVFALPENIIPVAMLPIGYRTDDCAPSPAHSTRMDMDAFLLK
jgi:nitroreductase